MAGDVAGPEWEEALRLILGWLSDVRDTSEGRYSPLRPLGDRLEPEFRAVLADGTQFVLEAKSYIPFIDAMRQTPIFPVRSGPFSTPPRTVTLGDEAAATDGLTVTVSSDDSGSFAEDASVGVELDRPEALSDGARRHGIGRYSVLQVAQLLLIFVVVLGWPYLARVVPPEAAEAIHSEQDAVNFVLALAASVIVSNPARPKQK
jgi:hypothetical protein